MIQIRQNLREYQKDALQLAIKENCALCIPTGLGKTLIGLSYAAHLLNNRKARRILVIEPTRFLVEQTYRYYTQNSTLRDVLKIYGVVNPEKRERLWREATVIVATPHTAYNDLPFLDFDAVIVDECHHTVGQHAYSKLMRNYDFTYRLGLSATIPTKIKDQIEETIGKIYIWSYDDPKIREFVPDWYFDVYDSELSPIEKDVYHSFEKLWLDEGYKVLRSIIGLGKRMLCRDGKSAIIDSLERGRLEILSYAYDKLKQVREDHKLNALREILKRDFDKAIIFVDRVIIAKKIAEEFNHLNPVLFMGKLHGGKELQEIAIKRARDEDTRLIVATTAGEEGIDLPDVDLLIIWSNVASSIRFVQRLGRIMRKTGKMKYAVFIATPDTKDYESLYKGFLAAYEAGINFQEVDIDFIRSLVKKTPMGKIVELVEDSGFVSFDEIREIYGVRADDEGGISRIRRNLSRLCNLGELFFVYYAPFDFKRLKKALINLKNRKYDPYLYPFLKRYWCPGIFYDASELQSLAMNGKYKEIEEIVGMPVPRPYTKFLSWLKTPIEISEEEVKNSVESGHVSFTQVLSNLFNIWLKRVENRAYISTENAEVFEDEHPECLEVPRSFEFEVMYKVGKKKRDKNNYFRGTWEENYEGIRRLLSETIKLWIGGHGGYTKYKIKYVGKYNEATLRIVIKNAGWLSYEIKELLRGISNSC